MVKKVSPEVLQSEVDLMNRLLLTFIDIEDLISHVTDNLMKEAENEPIKFVGYEHYEHGDYIITTHDVDRHIETAFQDIYDWKDNIPTIVYTEVHAKLDWKVVDAIEADLQEQINDQRAFQSDPLGYYGMSQRDFI